MRMKDIAGQEGKYAITDDGRIWCHGYTIASTSRWGTPTNKTYKPHWVATNGSKDGKWYISVALRQKNRKGYKIHRLLAEAFIPNPKNLKEVNHKNGIKTDNRLENLEWCTRKDNLRHAREMGLIIPTPSGAENAMAKLSWNEISEIRERYAQGEGSHRKLAIEYGVSFATIGQITRKKSYLLPPPQSQQ